MSTVLIERLPVSISIESIDLNVRDDDDTEWVFDTLTGWHDGGAVDTDQEQRLVAHGHFPQPGHRRSLTPTITGWVYNEDRAHVAAAVDRFAALLADGQFGELSVADDDTGTRTATVQLLGLSIDWLDPLVAKYQLQLLGTSPYKFGVTSSASTAFAAVPAGVGLVFPLFPSGTLDFGALGNVGQASVSNAGTAPAQVKFTISGPAPSGGFIITDTTTGKRIRYLGSLPAGSTLVINSADGSVVIDGTADRIGDTVVDAWPTIPPGQTRTFLFEPIGTTTAAVLTVECVSTYW